jgi:hypothetical protein
MASTLIYLYQPVVRDLPPDVDPGSLAWFGRWSSGHLSHADARLVRYGQENGLHVESQEMWYFEYQRLLAEAYWYTSPPATAFAVPPS